MTSWQGQRIDTDEHPRHRLHAGQRDRLLPRRRAARWPTRSARAREFVRDRAARSAGAGAGGGADRPGQCPARRRRRAAAQPGHRDRHRLCRARSISTAGSGLKQIVDSPDNGYARFETAGGATFSVQIDPEEKIVATTAIYFECDDLDERVEQLARSGIAFEHGPRNQPWMWREARLRDPDGNIIFLYKAGEARRFPPWRVERLIHRISDAGAWRVTMALGVASCARCPGAAPSSSSSAIPSRLAGVDEAGLRAACRAGRRRGGHPRPQELPARDRRFEESAARQARGALRPAGQMRGLWASASPSVEEIDTINIYWARMLAMTRAVEALGLEPAWVLVDGNACPRWQRPSKAIVDGDAQVPLDRRRLDHRQGHPRPDDGRAMRAHYRAMAGRPTAAIGTPDHRARSTRSGRRRCTAEASPRCAKSTPAEAQPELDLAEMAPSESSAPHHHLLSPRAAA